jgi:hypothetical protein
MPSKPPLLVPSPKHLFGLDVNGEHDLAPPIKNRRLYRRVQAIDQLPRRDQDALIRTIDAFLPKASRYPEPGPAAGRSIAGRRTTPASPRARSSAERSGSTTACEEQRAPAARRARRRPDASLAALPRDRCSHHRLRSLSRERLQPRLTGVLHEASMHGMSC